jgi:hypothetical protein
MALNDNRSIYARLKAKVEKDGGIGVLINPTPNPQVITF